MATETYFSDAYGTLDVQTDEATPTDVPVAGVMSATASGNWSMSTLYTADQGKPEDKKQSEFVANVEIEYAEFDPTIVEQWLGGDGASANSLTDTSDPQEFTLNVSIPNGTGTSLSCKVVGITFEEMPLFDIQQGEFMQWGLSGEGTDITNFEVV